MPDRFPEPTEAKRYLSRKTVVETEDWDDLKWGEHSHAFTVAHSRDAGVLDDIFGLINDAMGKGESYKTFANGLRGLMEEKGWYGRQDKTKDDESYINWRTKLIYQTNMRTAYSAGRYRQQIRGADLRPIWMWQSKLFGDNRRQAHLALHGKAFRYDDPFWNEHYPPDGWGCECFVETLSESGAEREGIDVLSSDADGKPPTVIGPDGQLIDGDKIASEEWRYNPGREALAPNFAEYTNLANARMSDGRTALRHVVDRYREDMDGTRMTLGEFKTLADRMKKKDYAPQGILYQVGNLNRDRHEAMRKAGVEDSKIMASDEDLYHGIADKTAEQMVPADCFEGLYETFQVPERMYENTEPKYPRQGREFHFVKDTKDGKVIVIVLRQKMPGSALRIRTMSWIEDQHGKAQYEEIW